jgi:hypothetical protein
MKILYVASNPRDENTLLLEREITSLQTNFGVGSYAGVSFTFLPDLRIENLPRQLSLVQPDILHISAHGSESGLTMASASGKEKTLTSDALSVFLQSERQPRLVILNACNSIAFAKELAKVVPMAVGISAEISNEAGRESIRLFYERILDGQSVQNAFFACQAMVKTIQNSTADADLFPRHDIRPDREFFLVSPRIIARFDNGAEADGDDEYEFSVGMLGCPKNTHQIVFFTDDTYFAEDEKNLESALCLVVRTTSTTGEIWADQTWSKAKDLRIFACVVTAGGEAYTASSGIADAIRYYLKVRNPDARIPAATARALNALTG